MEPECQKISKFRRILPQILATMAKNFVVLNVGQFFSFPSIVIPSLIGVSTALNPDEMIKATAAQTSWLSSFAHIFHPIGSLLSGPICDRIGRRKAILLVSGPLAITWIMLGFAQSFSLICLGFVLLGFCHGLKESPSLTYASEISEPAIRGTLMAISPITLALGSCIVLGCGAILSWRQVSLICALSPMSCFIAVLFVPDSPSWLLSKNRTKDALKALQWLRGWVSPRNVHDEFTELQHYSNISNACTTCVNESIKCYHPKLTFCDKIKEFQRKRIIKSYTLVFLLQIFSEFSLIKIWNPYIIQVLTAFGTPISPNLVTVIGSSATIVVSVLLLTSIKQLGRRKVYITSISAMSLCSISMSIYGYVYFPSRWTSFKTQANQYSSDTEFIRNAVGNFGYIPVCLVVIMIICQKIGVYGIQIMFVSEVFPFKLRSFLCGLSTAVQYLLTAIATKTYYNIEIWLSLSGAALFYGIISLIGLITMYFIMPETEQCSLEDIELHYSDNKKRITDIHIHRKSTTVE